MEKIFPAVDFSYQINLLKEKVEKRIFTLLCLISEKLFEEKRRAGVLIILGCFEPQVEGMRAFGPHRLEKYLNITSLTNEEEVLSLLGSGEDGAIIINDSGQILGIGIYLTVDNPMLDIPDGTGTRHISAASFSEREDVLAAFTLSEENHIVRKWKQGAITEQFNPADK